MSGIGADFGDKVVRRLAADLTGAPRRGYVGRSSGSRMLPSPVLILTNQLHTGGAEVYVVTVSRWLAR